MGDIFIPAVTAVLVFGIIVLWFFAVLFRLKILRRQISDANLKIASAMAKQYFALEKIGVLLRKLELGEELSAETVESPELWVGMAERTESQRIMSEMSVKITLLADRRPELAEAENFNLYRGVLNDSEERFFKYRSLYNFNTASFNRLLNTFPSNIAAKLARFSEKEFFGANGENDTPIRIVFN